MLNDELARCAAARADTGVPERIDRVRVGVVPLVVAFVVAAGVAVLEVGVEARGTREDADAAVWLSSVDDVRADVEGLGFLIAADMVGV